jgi:hypothetical protein
MDLDSGNAREAARMTRRAFSALCLAAILLVSAASSGCLVASIHPFYDDTGIVTDPALAGTWANPDDGVTIAIEPGEWNSYRIAFTDRTGTQTFTGHATRIGDRQFVDIIPAHGYERGELFVPLHLVFLVHAEGDTLTVRALSYEWFRPQLLAGRLKSVSGALDAKQNVLLTGTTEAIRAFIAHEKNDEMFGPEATLTRKR